MGTRLTHLFDGTPGAATTGNTGAASLQVTNTGASAVLAAGAAKHGTAGLRLNYGTGTGGPAMGRWNFAAAHNNVAVSIDLTELPATAPGVQHRIASFRHATGEICYIYRATNGNYWFGPAAGSPVALLTNANVDTAGMRLDIAVQGGSTTASAAQFAFFDHAGAQIGSTFSLTGLNLGTNAIAAIQLGPSSSEGGSIAYGYDTLQMEEDRTALIGAYAPPNVAPTLTVPGVQNVAAGATVSLTASATDSDGTIASYAWSVVGAKSSISPTLTGASTATVSLTAPAAGQLVTLQCVVTDNLGGTDSEEVEIRVGAAGAGAIAPLVPLSGVGITSGDTGAWTLTGGASSAGGALTDSSDTTGYQSPAYSSTASEVRIRLKPLLAFNAFSVTTRELVSATGGVTQLRLYDGNTLRKTWTIDQSTSATDNTVALTSGECSTIADPGNLWLGYVVSS